MRRSSRAHHLASSSAGDLVKLQAQSTPVRGRAGSICTSIVERDPLLAALTKRLHTDGGHHSSSWVREGGWFRWTYRRADSPAMEPADLLRGKARSRHKARVAKTASDTAAFGGLSNRDWSDAQRTSAETHWLSLEGLNLEVAEDLESAEMTSHPATSRQQLLEEVLQTKQLLQNKQRHKNSGGWTMTTAEVLNNADREELQVQTEAYRRQVQLRQRKMSAALKVQSPVTKTSDASCELSHGERHELQQHLQSLESHIRQSELCTRDTVTQIRSRRRQQLRTIQDLGVVDASLSVAAAPVSLLSPPATTPPGDGAGGDWEEAAPLRRPRSLHSPSVTRRRTPLRFISNLGRKQRRSGSEWEEASPEGPPEATSPLRCQISPLALQEIGRFERMMDNFLQQQQATMTPRRSGLPTVQQCL